MTTYSDVKSRLFRFKLGAALGLAGVVIAAGAPAARAQMVTGKDMTDFAVVFGLDKNPPGDRFDARLTRSSAPGNILWPGDAAAFTITVQNRSAQALTASGKLEVIAYGTRGKPGDIWAPTVYRIGISDSVPVSVKADPNGAATVSASPKIPARLGAYALVLDLGPTLGRRFVGSVVRTFKPDAERVQFPALSLDNLGPTVLQRLGVHAIRDGISYKSTTDADFERWYREQGSRLTALHRSGVTVLAMFGGGDFYHPNQPLGRPRPWLSDQNVMQDTKFDLAWLPSYDGDFRKFVARLLTDYGWPKGPITAASLWNEPWEGISISGWGADMLRYREIYTAMADGVDDARKAGAEVLVGGGDSSSNALDKFFPDGSAAFLPRFDFLSVHYQGMASFATYKPWVDRKSPRGRVRIWDTESWVANTDDRVAAVIAANRSAGYDRAMGVYGGNIHEAQGSGGQNAWSTAAAVGAAQHFLGDRPFRELLFKNGLPWVMVFDGLKNRPEDGTIVVVGDLGETFGANNVLFRTARGLRENAHKEALRKQITALSSVQASVPVPNVPAEAGNKPSTRRDVLQRALDMPETLSGATLTLPASGAYALYDFYGNLVPARKGRVVVPLDGRGFFLRGTGRPGSFAALRKAVAGGHIEGIEPLATVVHDLLAPIEEKPKLLLTLTNVLNRPVSGTLSVTLGGLILENARQKLSLAPHETRQVAVRVLGGKPSDANTYPLALRFDAGRDGAAVHHENVHANVVARRNIVIDGRLDDWRGVLPQTIVAPGSGAPSLTEAAWFPFRKFDTGTGQGVATGYLAYDDRFFYFAAKAADSTPDGGTLRFATRNDDQFFYPPISYAVAKTAGGFSARWSGFLTPKTSGRYTLSTQSDDGVRLFVEDKLVIDNWTDHGSTEDRSVPLTLVKGRQYSLRLEYYNSGGEGSAALQWEGPNQPRQLIAAAALTAADRKTPGLTGEYFSGKNVSQTPVVTPVVTRVDPGVSFTWRGGEMPDPAFATMKKPLEPLTWPEGVRAYSYRKDPILPAGNFPNFDNVQIAFNVLEPDRKRFYPNPPGTMPNYTIIPDTDYEYALNQVAPAYGGGTEIWRLSAPNLPLKHFYPRQPKSPNEGPVVGGKLLVVQDGTTRIVECAIPWREIPDVKRRLDAGQPIRFSFRVNDSAGGGMELSRDRSVAKRGGAFHVDWVEHWENQVAFGWGK